MAKRGTPKIVVIMSFAAALALAFVAVTLVLVTGADVSHVKSNQSVTVGPEAGLRTQIRTLGAVYYANPLGGDGFWLTAVDHELVALRLAQSRNGAECELAFDPNTNTFSVCDEPADLATLATLPLSVDDGTVTVDIRVDTD